VTWSETIRGIVILLEKSQAPISLASDSPLGREMFGLKSFLGQNNHQDEAVAVCFSIVFMCRTSTLDAQGKRGLARALEYLDQPELTEEHLDQFEDTLEENDINYILA